MAVRFLSLDYLKVLKIIFVLFVVIALGLVVYFPNYAKYKRIREERERLLSEMRKLQLENKQLQATLKKMTKDPSVLEKIARDDLGVAKKDEIVIDIER
jgi:cell division protein FtsB